MKFFVGKYQLNILFFTDVHAKAVWLYLPIGVSLIANIVMFGLTIKEICALDATMSEMGMANREKEMDR